MMPRQGTMIADRYRLERKVGGGRVSAMWRVQDQVTDGACAVKLLHRSMNDHPEALARFSLEDRLSRELTGDYFPERIGSGSWHSLRYIAWHWYEGECLRSLFERNPKQDVQTVFSIVQETCQALTLVHAAGYTHGDLKPENLFFAERPQAAGAEGEAGRQLKLLGFGVASRLARPLLGSQARRTPGQIVGTPLYLSPDLILGRVPRGGQADLWALAVIVYEALTGRAPFLGTDLTEVLRMILERQAPRPSMVTDTLPGTFDLWWAQALEQQFATPNDFATSLARALAPALRSSRTQRSASLPDRIGPVVNAVLPRPLGASPAPSPLGSARASSLTPAGGVTPVAGLTGVTPVVGLPLVGAAAGVGKALDVTPLASAVAPRSSVEPEARPGAARAAAPRPESNPPRPAASPSKKSPEPAAASAPAGSVLASTLHGQRLGTHVTSNTVAGIGPAALSAMRAMETAAAGATSKIRVSPPAAETSSSASSAVSPGKAGRDEPLAQDKFAPLPSPLRDLGGGARKTLVGIIPPSAPLHAPPAPSTPAAAGAPAAPAASSSLAPSSGQSLVIAGTPCRSIEVSSEDEAAESLPAVRRLGSPTVPFPRPRAAARAAAFEPDLPLDAAPLPPAQSWQLRTSNTLRIVLTDPDHRPHLVAGMVVCAAAALVIFVLGRSPVAGTGVLGQATFAAEPKLDVPATQPLAQPAAPPAPQTPAITPPAIAGDPGGDSVEQIPSASEPVPAGSGAPAEPASRGEELAPGLILPRSPAGGTPSPPVEKPKAPVPSPSPLPPSRPAEPARATPAGPAGGASPSLGSPQAPEAPKLPVKKPPPAGGDFDFGI